MTAVYEMCFIMPYVAPCHNMVSLTVLYTASADL